MKRMMNIKQVILGTAFLMLFGTLFTEHLNAQRGMSVVVNKNIEVVEDYEAPEKDTKVYRTDVPRPISFADTTSEKAQRIIKSLDSLYKIEVSNGFNGGVMIGYKGKVLYERYHGLANRATKVPWGPNTSSQLASTSKPFTATAILWLHQHSYLNIYDLVSDYIEGFPYKNVTIEMLLNHRSGIPDYLKWATRYWTRSKNMTNDDLVDLMIRHRPALQFPSGTRFTYSNSNYALLATILEEVTQLPYAQFMKEFIFEPLGLHNTFVYNPIGKKPDNLAISYKANWQIDPDMYADGIYGDKGIFSSLEDMYLWDRSFYDHILLKPETLALAYKGYSNGMSGKKNYGLGWRMDEYNEDIKLIYHNGWWHGNNTVYFRYVEDDFTIIVLGNRYNRRIYKQRELIHNIIEDYELIGKNTKLKQGVIKN